MLQTGLAAAFGFFAALFLVLLLAPAVARRVSELTWRQATRVLPQSSEEIAAARDHLRGQNALEMRQLEMKMDIVSEKERQLRIGQLAFQDKISKLTGTTEQLGGTIKKLEAEKAQLTHDLGASVQENAMLSTENADRDIRLSTLSAEFAHLRDDHTRQIAAFNLMQEAQKQAQQRFEVARNDASQLRAKVSAAESEFRMARTDAKRHESDAKLANRKISALEGKLERSIRLLAEAEEKLERRDAEVKRLKEQSRPQLTAASQPVMAASGTAPVKAAQLRPAERIVENATPETDLIVAQIKALRPALRVAARANDAEKARLRAEMMDLTGRITAQAAAQNSGIMAKIEALQPGSALADVIIKHKNAALEKPKVAS